MAADELIEKIKALPPELIKSVENFVDMISIDRTSVQQTKDRSQLFGALKGKITIKNGFDDPIEGMEDYM